MKRLLILMLILTLTYKSGDAKNNSAYDFKLLSSKGKYVRLSDFKGKVVVMDFWFTGCINCMNFYRASLSNAERHYEHNEDVVFISICIDKDKSRWLNSLAKGMYTSKTSVNLYTEGQGDQHPVIKNYQVKVYPQPIVIGKQGEIISRSDNLAKGTVLINAIDGALKH